MALEQVCACFKVLDTLNVADVDGGIRAAAETIDQALIEAELAKLWAPHRISAPDERTAQLNRHRSRTLSTTVEDLEMRIPKLRTGSFLRRCSREQVATTPATRLRSTPDTTFRTRRGGGSLELSVQSPTKHMAHGIVAAASGGLDDKS